MTCDICSAKLYPEEWEVAHGKDECVHKHVALLMKAQECGKRKPSMARWICFRCSRAPGEKPHWAQWLSTEDFLLRRREHTDWVCAGCIGFAANYVEQVKSERVEPPDPAGAPVETIDDPPPPPGLPAYNIAGPPPPPPLGASGLVPTRAEFQELQRAVNDIKRRQARLYMERCDRSWDSLPDYLDGDYLDSNATAPLLILELPIAREGAQPSSAHELGTTELPIAREGEQHPGSDDRVMRRESLQ